MLAAAVATATGASDRRRSYYGRLAETLRSPWLRGRKPTPKQAAFMLLDCQEALYGGAAGGGKSEALLMSALQDVDTPGYAALLLRRTYADLAQPGALISRSMELLCGTRAHWRDSQHAWRFPSGAVLQFGYLATERDKYNYQSSEYQFIGFDELTQFGEAEYRYLFSRLRRRAGVSVPLRMRSASNPGGIGHDWVRARFVASHDAGRRFVPAVLQDNPYVDVSAYEATLARLDPQTRAQLLKGDWDAGDDGLLAYEWIVDCQADTLWDGYGPPEDGVRRDLYIGVDVGRTRDLTVVWTWEKVGDVLWAREVLCLDGEPFRDQRTEIARRLDDWGRDVIACQIDQGGIGMQLAEDLAREFECVEGVSLTSGRQGQLAQQMATAFGERSVRIPDDDDLRRDLRQVRRVDVTAAGVTKVETNRSDVGHADRFWAAALGLDACLHAERRITTAHAPRLWRPKR